MEVRIKHIDKAIAYYNENDLISSDDCIQHLFALLPEIFSFRSLSDGFRAIVNTIFHAINNMKGIPINCQQMRIIRIAFMRAYTEPFLDFGEAVDEIMKLEDAGFEIEPEYFKSVPDETNG